jgi:hypothetical protein
VQRRTAWRTRTGRTTTLGAGVLLAVSFGLAGCGGSSSGSGPTGPTTVPTIDSTVAAEVQATAEALASAIGSAVAKPDSTSGGGAVSAQEICDTLTSAQATLTKEKGTPGALATLTLQLADLYTTKDAIAKMSGSDIDAMTQATCPDARKAALDAAGISTFAQL